jgi:hypothetical protein
MKRALVLSLIFAVGLGIVGFGATLSGKWDTDLILDFTQPIWPAGITVVTVLDVDYTVGDWTFGSYTKISNGAWGTQYFDAAGVLGAFTITSKLEFDPANVAFKKWTSTVDVSIAGVTFGAKFELVPLATKLTLTGSGVAGDVTIGVTVVLGDLDVAPSDGCDLDFASAKFVVGFPFCCADVTSTLYITCEGFDYVKFCVSDLTIENLPWLTLGACVQFQTDSKVFTLSPEIDLGVIGCDFDLFYTLKKSGGTNYAPLLIDGIYIDGIQIACEIGGVAFTGITYWGDDVFGAGADESPGILAGYEEYWEAYQIATTDDGCCGPFSFDVTVFFDEDDADLLDDPAGADELFDVAYLVANMSIQIATQFTFDMGVETDLEAGTVNKWTFGFLVEW